MDRIVSDDRSRGLTAFYNRIYAVMGLGVLTSAAIAFIMIHFFAANILAILSGGLWVTILFILVPLVLAFSLSRSAANNSPLALPLFFVYSGLMGFVLSFILLAYTASDITISFIIAAGMFFGLSVIGRVTKRDLSGMGKALGAAVFGIIIALGVNLFLQSSWMLYVISIVTVVVFSGLIAWDNQKIARLYDSVNGQVQDGWAISMAFSLYLDFLNLFIALLRIVGGARG